jgi:hypothetical protein
MTPEGLLLRHPAETLPWLRRQVPLGRHAFAAWLGVSSTTVAGWEQGVRPLPLVFRRRLVPLVARYLTTEEGRALLRALAEEGE